MDFHFLVMEKLWKIKVEKDGAHWSIYDILSCLDNWKIEDFQGLFVTQFESLQKKK